MVCYLVVLLLGCVVSFFICFAIFCVVVRCWCVFVYLGLTLWFVDFVFVWALLFGCLVACLFVCLLFGVLGCLCLADGCLALQAYVSLVSLFTFVVLGCLVWLFDLLCLDF